MVFVVSEVDNNVSIIINMALILLCDRISALFNQSNGWWHISVRVELRKFCTSFDFFQRTIDYVMPILHIKWHL